ncbi:MAG TPA: hypothetical protein VFZ52_10140 [Chryseolinea sp.]
MKKFAAFLIFLLILSVIVYGQHPLVGTWEMVTIKGIDANGQKFSSDTSAIREIKVITPTHYMLIAQDVEGDSLVFNRCYAGAVKFEGENYHETPLVSSVPIFDDVKTDFKWKVVGDRFIQSGTIIRPDGKKVVLDELVFRRVKTRSSYANNPANGTWKLLTTKYTTTDGASHSETNETVVGFQFITPTHWMYVSSKNKKFEHAMGGAYSMKGDKVYPNLDVASFPKSLWGKTEWTQKFEGDKLRVNGTSVFPDGKKFTWEDYFEKIP